MSKVVNNLRKALLGLLVLGLGASNISSCARGNVVTAAGTEEIKIMALMVVPSKNRVDVLDMQTNRVTRSLDTDSNPTSIAVSPNGRMILVTNKNSNSVSVFVRRGNDTIESLGSIGTGVNPSSVAFDPSQFLDQSTKQLFYGNIAFVTCEDGTVLILDTSINSQRLELPKIIQTISLPSTFRNAVPKKIVVSYNYGVTGLAYILDSFNGNIIVLRNSVGSPGGQYQVSSLNLNLGKGLEDAVLDDKVNITSQKMSAYNTLFVANSIRNEIYILDTNIQSPQPKTIPLNPSNSSSSIPSAIGQQASPKKLAVVRQNLQDQNGNKYPINKLFVTGNGNSTVYSINLTNNYSQKTISLVTRNNSGDSYGPVGIGLGKLSSGQDVMYVTNTSGRTISLIDPINDSPIRNISTTASAGAQDPLGEVATIGAMK